MKRILYYKFFDGASEVYRLKPLEYIDRTDMIFVECKDATPSYQSMQPFDAIFLLRPQGQIAIDLIKTAKRWHKKVIIDWDDCPLTLDQYHPMYSLFQHEMKSTIECITLADEVWVSTLAIKNAFRLYNKNIHIIPNSHDDWQWPIRLKRPFTYNKIATYRGGESHYGDVYDLGVPEQIIEMVNSNKDWQFTFFGQRFHYLEKRCGNNYVSYPGGWDFIEFQNKVQQQNACLSFYPLSNSQFNKSKSNIFWIEMSYAGSAVFGNKKLPEYNKDCIGDISEIEACMKNEECLNVLNKLSWECICDEYLLSKVNSIREERFMAI